MVVVGTALLALVAAAPANADAPVARTGPATSVGARSAIVSGAVDARGASTSWYVEYGTTTAYGARTEARSAGNGTSAVDVSQQLTRLETGVTYHYRVVATNAGGTSRGADQAFTTSGAPEVATGAAWAIGPTSANVGGSVDPNGRSTGWWIEYGPTTRYGSRTDTRSAGSGPAPIAVSVRLTGLAAGATYHFRVVAANDIGARPRRGPVVPNGQRAVRRDGLGRRDLRLHRAPQRPRRSAWPRDRRLVRVRDRPPPSGPELRRATGASPGAPRRTQRRSRACSPGLPTTTGSPPVATPARRTDRHEASGRAQGRSP